MFDLYEEFKNVIRALADNEIDYAVCGGMALAVYGIPRATIDIDILISPKHDDEAGIVARMLGYAADTELISLAQGKIQILRFVKFDPEGEDYFNLDFLLVTPALEFIWNDRKTVEWETQSLSIVSKEGLISLKSLRNSGQDRDDIERLRELT